MVGFLSLTHPAKAPLGRLRATGASGVHVERSCGMILSSACCTPSAETSRVIEGLSDLREILSISQGHSLAHEFGRYEGTC
jgi:hypothetical protein